MEVNRLEQRGSSWVGEKSNSGCTPQLQQGLVTKPDPGWGSRNKAAYETGWDQGAMIKDPLRRPLWMQRTLCHHHPIPRSHVILNVRVFTCLRLPKTMDINLPVVSTVLSTREAVHKCLLMNA